MTYLHYFFPFLFGIIFSVGLGISGMMSPRNVQGFLDLFGQWNPSLFWVLGGAVMTTLLFFPLALRRYQPFFSSFFALPSAKEINAKLLLGSALFGVGWALSGLCPGPAFANILSGNINLLVFVLFLLMSYALLEQNGKK